jgi:hypothetical protein
MNVMQVRTRPFTSGWFTGLAALGVLALVAGCAEGVDPGSGGQGSSGDGRFGGDTPPPDAGTGGGNPTLPGSPDASPFVPDAGIGFGDEADAEPPPPPEAGAERVTLTYNASTEIAPELFAACRQDGFQTRNIYLRVFDFADFGVTSDFLVETVSIAVERADSPEGSQPLNVLLARQSPGAPDMSAPVFENRDIVLSNGQLGFLNVRDIDEVIPAGQALTVVFVVPDGTENENLLQVGVNREPENAPAFIIAPDCGVDDPAPFGDFFTTRWIVSVTGVHER